MARTAAIVGVADTPLRAGRGRQVQARAAKVALDEARLALRDVDALFAAGSWGVPGPGIFVTSTPAEYLGLRPGCMDGAQIGGPSFEAQVATPPRRSRKAAVKWHSFFMAAARRATSRAR
jgi:hypothetical protein